MTMVLVRIGSLRGWKRSPRLRLLALVVLAAALVLAGCSGTPAGSSAPAPGVDVKPSAAALQEQFVQVVKQVGPSVVLIQTSEGLGSGVVFDAKGDVVTNNHVVEKADGFQVTLANGRRYPAQLVGTFPADDLAVLRIDAGGLHPAAIADSSRLQVGDVALAIGNPLGLQSSVTEGIVSALGRTVNEDNGVALPNVIQTSAAINPGNSGGALVDLQGRSSASRPWPPPTPSSAAAPPRGSASPSPATPCATSPPSSSARGRWPTPTAPGWVWRWPPPPATGCLSPRCRQTARPPRPGSAPAT
jgi:putative serine protease PepD